MRGRPQEDEDEQHHRGELDAAQAALDASAEAYARSLGPDSLALAQVDFARARLALSLGELERGRELVDAALPTYIRELGSEHLELADLHEARGVFAYFAEDYAGSLIDYRKALEIREAKLGTSAEDNELLALTHSNIGESLAALGRHDAALAAYGDALERVERRLGPEHALAALPLKGRGLAQLHLGQVEPAIESLERALAIHEANPGEPIEAADTRLALARALERSDNPGSTERASALLAQARVDFEALGMPERVDNFE